MVKIKLTTILLCQLLVTSLFAISAPSDLVVIPQGVLPQRGHCLYGVETQVYKDSSSTTGYNNVLFFNIAFDEHFQAGLKSTEDHDTLFSGKLLLQKINYQNLTHYVTLGTQNLNWSSDDAATFSYPVYQQYFVYSLEVPKQNSFYHLGVGTEQITQKSKVFVGANYNFKSITTMAEWDGFQVHFGLYYRLKSRFNYFFSITPSPTDKFGSTENYFSFAITTTGSLFKNDEDLTQVKSRQTTIENKLNVIDAKTNVVREFSSLDFLEEFQQFLITEGKIEKSLEKEQKTTIRQALIHMQRGLERYYQQEYTQALNEYTKVINLVPTLSIGYARIGSIYYKLNDLENAKLNWEKALELNPSNDNLSLFLKQITPKKSQETQPLTEEQLEKIILLQEDRS